MGGSHSQLGVHCSPITYRLYSCTVKSEFYYMILIYWELTEMDSIKGDVILVSGLHACISIMPPMENCGGCDHSQVLISPATEDVPPRRGDAWQFWCNWAPPPSSRFPISNGHPIALGAALVTGGKLSPYSNYLDDHILFSSASNASLLQKQRVPWAVFAWKYLRIAAPQSAGGSVGNQRLPFYPPEGSGKVLSLQTSYFHFNLRSAP